MPGQKNKIEEVMSEFDESIGELNKALATLKKVEKSADRLDIVEARIVNLSAFILEQAETIGKLNTANSALVDGMINLQARLERIEGLLLNPPNPRNMN